MALAAKLYRLDNRQSDRLPIEVDATVRASAAQPIDANVIDVSETGFRAVIEHEIPIGAEISIGLPGVGVIEGCIVRRDGNEYGARFLAPITAAAIARATSAETVIAFPAAAPTIQDLAPDHAAALPAGADDRMPGWMSLGIIIGSSAALWTAIIGGARVAIA